MSTECEPWPLVPECLPSGWPAAPSLWTPTQATAVDVAMALLRKLTAGQYGLCKVKVRPYRRRSYWDYWRALRPSLYDSLFSGGVLSGGRPFDIPCGCVGNQCGCGQVPEIPLDPQVYDILEVKVDGVVLPATAYRVDDRRMLVRTDGGDWPPCQQLGMPDTAVDTFSVTYRRGVMPDKAGQLALTVLAVEMAKACSGDKKCALPSRVTSIVREGITYDLLDNLDVFERGRTGLPRVDMWLAAVNPHAARAPMRVYSPDTVRSRTTAWPVQTSPDPTPDPTPVTSQSFRWVQPSPAKVWTIVHNMGFYPAGVSCVDSDGVGLVGDPSYPDVNTVRIEFGLPRSGVAYLS